MLPTPLNPQIAQLAADGSGEQSLVLLFMRKGRDRELLADTLSESFRIEKSTDPDRLQNEFDCCILDLPAYRDVKELIRRRSESATAFLPIVLLIPENQDMQLRSDLWDHVDDVIDVPIRRETLEARVRNLTERRNTSVELAERQAELAERNDRLDTFASVVSHDLRNPLRVAEGRLELAQEERESEDLTTVSRALDRMETLIEDLLVLAREGADDADLEVISLAEIVEASWLNVDTKDATLAVETDAAILGHQSQLHHLFENLIRNAVEHGGDDVTIRVGAMADGFFVADNGSGIPEAERPAVLDSGYSTNTDGTGLGLAIVSQMADIHGWDVQVTESEAGGGRFEFSGVQFA